MPQQLEAAYEHGVLRVSPEPDYRDEIHWLATHSGPYRDLWVALVGSRLIAHGPKLAEVLAAARSEGVEKPFLASIPDPGDKPFGGW